MSRSDPLGALPAFESKVRQRLEAGAVTYGNRSFSADPSLLLDELQQEALDLAGWGYVLWCRLEAMRMALSARAPVDEPSPPRRMVGADRCSP